MKSQVEVEALVEHIREEVRRRRDRLPMPSAEPEAAPTERLMPAAPVLPAPDEATLSAEALLVRTGQLIAQAQSKTEVNKIVPKGLRPFWRNQGGYNATVLNTVETLRDANQLLAAENVRLREHSASQAEWMNRLARAVEQLQTRLAGLERQNDHDQRWFEKLQTHAQKQAAEMEKLHQRSDGQTRHVQSGLEQLAEQQMRLDRSLARLDDRQMTDASFLKHQFWLQQRRLEVAPAEKVEAQGETRRPVEAAELDHDGSGDAKATGDLDALYLAFENVFRGSRQDIKQRLEFYLPYLRKARLERAG